MNELKSNIRLLALTQKRQSLMLEMRNTSDMFLKRSLATKLSAVEKQLRLMN